MTSRPLSLSTSGNIAEWCTVTPPLITRLHGNQETGKYTRENAHSSSTDREGERRLRNMEDVSGGDRPPAEGAAIIHQPMIEPGTSQEGAREPGTGQEGAREPSTGQEGAREPGTGQEGAREPSTGQEGAREPSTGQEGAREPGTGQEGAREPGTGQEGAREPGTGQEGARDPKTNQESTTDTSTTEEGTSESNTSHKGTREPNTSLEGAREPNTSQEGTRELNISQEGTREPNISLESANESNSRQEGTIEPNTSPEGANKPISGLEGTRELNSSQVGTREPSPSQEGPNDSNSRLEGTIYTIQEGTRDPDTIQGGTRVPEASVGQESVGDLSTWHIKSNEAMEEDCEIGSSQQPSEEPEGTSDDPSEPHNESDQYVTEIDQEPNEETHHLLDEEAAEQNQDHELQEEQIREELIQQYHSLVQERDKILQHNAQLQHKLYEYFRKKKGEETRPETSKHTSDQEQRYLKYLTSLEEMRRKYKEEAALHQEQVEELRSQCQEIVSRVDKEWTAFQEQKKKIALCSLSKQGAGKHAASSLIQEVDLLQSREERKEKEVIQVRLENIKLKNHINRYESTLRSKEELAEGLHLIDFEQLKIENQTYNEKIEERNEELLKLRKKITSTVQVLTHVKEKLQFVQAENQQQKEKLMEVEFMVAKKRDILTKTKQVRDSLRMDNLKLKQKCGLLGNKVLLRDFEDKVDSGEDLRQTLENLKRRHAELTLSSKGLEKKINEAKLVMDG
ncbi:cilia- and flagella-associated protein 184 [Anomaloglossus baeobatrachus]|uniref:cilia- and flagella-associated protein 184 n=1 Tax=Anomaloglossus baeobatrachus TaxID=238106 RepID=UPI003F508714